MSINLREAILKEHSKKQCDTIVNYIGSDPKKFKELMKLLIVDEKKGVETAAFKQRAKKII